MEVPHGAAQSLPDSGGVRGLDHNDPMKGAAPGAKLGADSLPLAAPFPWFGGKSQVAELVWKAFGNPPNYVEPFVGSAAMLLARPHWEPDAQLETINDADGFVANFWRAMSFHPEEVAFWAEWPVNEADLHARHGWLINRREKLLWALGDPDWCDPKIAGWWLWGQCMWIGSGWCSGQGPWVSNGAEIVDRRKVPVPDGAAGAPRGRPHLGNAGRGINRKLPHLGDAGRAWEHLQPIAERLRDVRVCCGDWSRVLGPTPTIKLGLTGVFLDPPYGTEDRSECYSVDSTDVAADVTRWCAENGGNQDLRIALCGYQGESHHELEKLGWRVHAWKTRGGYGLRGYDTRGRENSTKERIWFSPHCIDVRERGLFYEPDDPLPPVELEAAESE
jgi:DNA adenine methylase